MFKSKNKKYHYLYLQEKLRSKYSNIEYQCEMYDCWDEIETIAERHDFYAKWLNKINKKYKYV